MKNKQGFTLVELLVVVAIIALLLAIMLPALSKSREAARTVVCLSNLKHMQTGWISYIENDSDGIIPRTKQTYKGYSWVHAMNRVYPQNDLKYGSKKHTFVGCPSTHHANKRVHYPYVNWGYTINCWWANKNKELNEHKNWRRIRHTSDYPWFIDGQTYQFGGSGSTISIAPFAPYKYTNKFVDTPTWGIGMNHVDETANNTAFADGSVRTTSATIILEQMVGDYDYPWLENKR